MKIVDLTSDRFLAINSVSAYLDFTDEYLRNVNTPMAPLALLFGGGYLAWRWSHRQTFVELLEQRRRALESMAVRR